MKPPVPYFGSKATLGPTIAALLPEHEHYVEPYFGSGCVLFAKRPSRYETVNDLDRALTTFWRVLRDRADDLERVCRLTPHSRAEFDDAEPLAATDELELARQVFVRLTQGRNGQLGGNGWRYDVATTTKSPIPNYLATYAGRITGCERRLRCVTLECRPALDVIRQYGAEPAVCLYVDPPYLGSVRGEAVRYRQEMLTPDEHRELAKALHECKAAVVLSGYPSDLYDRDLYAGWHRHAITAATTQAGARAAHERTEVLWSNRPLGMQPSLLDALDEPFPSTTPSPAGTVPAETEGE